MSKIDNFQDDKNECDRKGQQGYISMNRTGGSYINQTN